MSNKKIIAKIKLALGEVGFYDESTGIYLTKQSPESNVYAGMNCMRISEAVKNNKVILLEGSLVPSRVKQIFKIKQDIISVDKDIEDTKDISIENITEAKNVPPDTKSEIKAEEKTEDSLSMSKEEISTTEMESENAVRGVMEEEKEPTVNPITIMIDGEKLAENTISITKGRSVVLSTSIKNVVLSSSNTSIVSITKKGKMTAKNNGEATVSVIADGYDETVLNVVVVAVTEAE